MASTGVRARPAGWAVALLATLVLVAPATGAGAQPEPEPPPGPSGEPDPPAPPDPLRPGAATAPELAGVPATSPQVEAATRALADARAATADAKRAKADQERALVELAAERDEAVAGVERAEGGVADAEARERDAAADLAAAEQHLTQAELEVIAAERAAEAARQDLSRTPVASYVSGASDGVVMAETEPERYLEAGQRRVLSRSAVNSRTERWRQRLDQLAAAEQRRRDAADGVTAAQAELAEAGEGVRAARDRLAEARQAVLDREADLADGHDEDRRRADVIGARLADEREAEAVLADRRILAPVGGADFPLVALDAYWKAAQRAPCRTEWWALAGIGYVETKHGTYLGSALNARGQTVKPIIGIPLNGGPLTALIGDSDGGGLDGDPVWDRAVGPMQFIPSTWRAWQADGNGDGQADPNNLYDATAAAARYLCAGRTDLTDEAELTAGYLSYNQSPAYVAEVLARARQYQAQAAVPVP